ncbi:MAG TPA: hypothetical protein VMW57_10255 [Methyloceanibacter sp.]|nr:hypothetical protein [Methyloceanibacter sp.]
MKDAKALNTEIAKPAKTAEADNEALDDKAMDDKAMAEKVTEETDINGTEDQAMDEKPTPPAFKYVTQQAPCDWTA